ncbi:MAG: TRAP transporter substrate-binding protein [Clostridium sp.]|nr:TRAP transporter substrate-binding protein [Clostridium sp.]
MKRNVRRAISTVIAGTMVFSMMGCNTKSTETTVAAENNSAVQTEAKKDTAAADNEKYTLSINTAYDVKSPMCVAAQKFCDDVKEASNGRLEINLFTNSALGSEKESYIAVAGNELDGLIGGCLGLDMYAPAYSFLSAPFLFEDMDHVKAVMESKLGDGMKQDFLDDNIRTISVAYRAPRVMSSSKPINTPADLNGLKMRVSEMSSWVSIWGADTLGATAITVALGELYNALQTGTAEASEGPYEQLATYKFYEVQDYFINTDHVYEWVVLCMSDEAYQKLPEDLQKIITDCAEEDFAKYCTELSEESDETYKQELLDNGMEEINPDRDAFREKALASYEKWFKDTWTVTNYDEVMSYAK